MGTIYKNMTEQNHLYCLTESLVRPRFKELVRDLFSLLSFYRMPESAVLSPPVAFRARPENASDTGDLVE